MTPYDFEISKEGDLNLEYKIIQGEVTEGLDLIPVEDDKLRAQIALNRIKSVKRDWYFDNIGADIEEVIGFPATNETDEYICKKIRDALIFDGYFNLEDIYIDIITIDVRGINYAVYIKTLDGKSAITISVDVDLTQGIDVYLEGVI